MTRWIWFLASGGALLLWVAGLIDRELLSIHLFQSWLYLALVVLLRRQSKIALLWGFAIGMVWDLMHLWLTRWIVTSAFGLWFNWRVALDTNPNAPIVLLLGSLNLVLAVDCGLAYARRADRRWSDLGVLLGMAILVACYYGLLLWLFQPQWIKALFALAAGE